MSYFFRLVIAGLGRAMIWVRYRVEVKGLEKLSPERLNRPEGILFIPNHSAHIDPVMNFVRLWPKYKMRPLVVEFVFNIAMLKPFLYLVRSIPIPNFEAAVNEWKLKKAEKAIGEITEGLKKGDNFIVYPAGRLKSTGKEMLGGTSGVHELIKACPDANIVLIRTTGLWGSSFSRALLGRSPDVMETLKHGIKVLLKNLILFTPRRKVLIEIEPNPEDMPREGVDRIELNRYLENWFNRYPDEQGNIHEVEPIKLVSYSCWHEELPEVVKLKARKNGGAGEKVTDETKRKIYNEIRKILEKPDLEIKPEMNLAFDLGMDSLNIAEFITYLTKSFDVRELHPEDLETVGTVLEIAEKGKESPVQSRPPVFFTWPEEHDRPSPMLPIGRTLPDAFLNSCERMNNFSACGDDLLGVLTYKKLRRATLVLAQYFKTWKEDRIAILLPASAGAYIAILAIQMAGKVPVMLNWTLGPRYLEEMMKLSGALGIVTSERFLDRLANVQFGACLEKLVPLEKIRKSLTLKMKLHGLFLSYCHAQGIKEALNLESIDENSPSVILFTSGTEASPKGVPLSHKNILSNQRSAMHCIDLRATDAIYAILPPFHSFGFSVAGLFPILCGMKMAFYPDPTDSFALAEGVERWKISIFCSAPSFLRGLFHAAKKEQLKTIRYFISGAEKAPQELFDRAKKINPAAVLAEGYGITECSPILSLNRLNMPPKGVGRLLPGVELITIHPETLELLPPHADGEICVRGPNIFNGYLGNPRSPFIEIQGKQWYRTGDLGHMDPEGNLILSGRLKRFTKLGGEMISIGAVEETIAKALMERGRISSDVPSIAVCADEKEEGKPRLILFSTIDLDTEEANQILQESGFSNLVKISAVKKIDEIPVMGAGKTDYRSLQALC